VEGVKGEITSYLWYIRCLHVHSQYTTKYLGRRIVSIIWADSDITVAALIEVIHGLTTYQFVMTKFGGLRSMP
jgi:hypothetical protein